MNLPFLKKKEEAEEEGKGEEEKKKEKKKRRKRIKVVVSNLEWVTLEVPAMGVQETIEEIPRWTYSHCTLV